MAQYIVTTTTKPAKRYVLCDYEDEDQAATIAQVLADEAEEKKDWQEWAGDRPFRPFRPLFWFGARLVRKGNAADECYRSLSISDVKSIKKVADGHIRMTP